MFSPAREKPLREKLATSNLSTSATPQTRNPIFKETAVFGSLQLFHVGAKRKSREERFGILLFNIFYCSNPKQQKTKNKKQKTPNPINLINPINHSTNQLINHSTRNPKPETRNPKLKTRNPKPETHTPST